MPVEQGLPWHPVATGLAGQAIPFIVAASHAHALPSVPFWFPVPAVPVASPALVCPSSLSDVLALVSLGVAPVFCVSVSLLPLSFGTPGCPCRAPPRVPPTCPPPRTRISHLHTTWTVPCAVGSSRPYCHPRGGHLPAQPPPLWSTWAPCRRGGGVADGSLGSACAAFGGCYSARTSWFPCVLLCVLLGLVSLPCVGRLCAHLFCCSRSSHFRALSFSAGTLTAAGVRRRGGSMLLPTSPCGCRVVPLAVGWCQGHRALLHVSKSTN